MVGKAVDPVTTLVGFSTRRAAAAFLPHGGHAVFPTDEFLRAEVPSANGVFTARSLAKLYAVLGSADGIDGLQLWSTATRDAARARQNNRRDRVLPVRVGWRLGYHAPFPHKRLSPGAFGFYGAYGSGAFTDPERGLAVALVCQQARGLPLTRLIRAITEAADAAEAR